MTNTTPQKEMAPTVSAVEATKEIQKPLQFSAKSTATQAQYERIVKMLRISTRSTFDFRKAGIMAPAARIKELNDKHGYYIPTIALRDLWDDEGFMHPRVAVYELIDEPGNSALTAELAKYAAPFELIDEPHGERAQ